MKEYIYLFPKVIIKSYTNTTFKIYYLMLEEMEHRNYRQDEKIYQINEVGKEILLLLNGTLTYNDLIEYFKKKYKEPEEEISDKISKFLKQLENFGYTLCTQDYPLLRDTEYYEFENYYPTVASLELANTCNIRCRHCYGCFGEKITPSILNLEQIKKAILAFKEIGLSILELTGGDPTMNPYCAEAVEFAIESGINTIMFLTNGVNISKKLFETLKKYRKQLYVQIDLHSLEEEYYDWFTASQGNLENVKNNINLLISEGIKVRICAIFTPGNLNEMYKIGEYAYNQGAVQYAPSVVVDIGRAKYEKGLLFENMNQLQEFKKMQNALADKYPGFVQEIKEIEGMTRKNCGAIRSEISIDVFGNIKLCNMDSGSNFNINMGNILNKNIKTIFTENKEFLDALADVRLPDMTQNNCIDCSEKAFCHSCLLRGFLSAKHLNKNGQACNWYYSLPDIIRERFQLVDCLE